MITASHVAGGDLAADRVYRIMGSFIAAGYIFYLVLVLGNIRAAATVTAAWWTPIALLLIFGSGISVGIFTFGTSRRSMARACGAAALGYLAACALWIPAWNGALIPDVRGMYFSQFNGLASLAAAAAWRPHWAFAHLAAAAATGSTINHVARSAEFNGPLLPEIAWSFGFCLLPVAAGVMALRTGRILDETRAETYASAASSAAVQARSVERGRFDALTHDGVMSTLLSAARQPMNSLLALQAKSTLSKLDSMRDDGKEPDNFDTETTISHIRGAANEVDGTINIQTSIEAEAADANYPRDAVRTMAAALAEALRNSNKHAGDLASRSVSLHVTIDEIAATVTDNGHGFDLEAVPAHRLGVSVSILGRMRDLSGGGAAIKSEPGCGTRVHLTWSRMR